MKYIILTSNPSLHVFARHQIMPKTKSMLDVFLIKHFVIDLKWMLDLYFILIS